MSGKHLLLFDMDGTLILERKETRFENTTAQCLQQSRQQMRTIAISYGIPSSIIDPLNRMAHIWNGARRYAENNSYSTDKTFRLMTELNEPFSQQEKGEHSKSILLPGTIETLATLHGGEYPLGIVTTASRAGYERISKSKKFGSFGRYFAHSITRDDCDYIKPDPEPIIRILKLFNRSDFIYVGDSDHDAEAAKAAGGRFILVNTKQHNEETLLQINPDRIIDSLRELPEEISLLEQARLY
jgi:HAD superfamily hydrolase (TIGR01549 family)